MRRLIKRNKYVYVFFREIVMCVKKKYFGWKNISKKSWVVSGQRFIAKDFMLGEFGFVGEGCTIYPKVTAGRFVMFAPDVSIIGADHASNFVGTPICFSGREKLEATIIGDDVWIGQGATIKVGVTIGDGVIVAAKSMVTKDVPEFAVVAGVPAKILRYRFEAVEDRVRHIEAIKKITNYGAIENRLE